MRLEITCVAPDRQVPALLFDRLVEAVAHDRLLVVPDPIVLQVAAHQAHRRRQLVIDADIELIGRRLFARRRN